ncbi:conserved Plasmodium protein, unknown function [Plasmodium gallinaceum]|uniref:Uncharacterized protein n=1 Tax=Plasmodium gallinaceum TaxID=5849 RepID=A0A1J1GMB1_PLAGA|nr:conserved Plasmodium protein, unknown function [Plasmodium gallinaceum]CRG93566.1 conserved Plasmodium protein, unknown function [Plasmodium gallinaceum]
MNEKIKWNNKRTCKIYGNKLKDLEQHKKDFTLFYITDLLNIIYNTYKSIKPVYIHFICSKKNENLHPKKNNLIYYTPNSILEQYFPEYFQNVYFLCAHYTIWENKINENRNDTYQNYANKKEHNEHKLNNLNENDTSQNNENKETFYFIFTFYMEPNFIWEEINIPIFHERGYIECKFDSIDNLMKINSFVNLSDNLRIYTYNKTLIQYIFDLSNNNNITCDNSNINKNKEDCNNFKNVHLLPFFISTDYLHKNCKICKTRVISFNEKDIYCKIDEEENLPKSILLFMRKKLNTKLKSIEKEAAKEEREREREREVKMFNNQNSIKKKVKNYDDDYFIGLNYTKVKQIINLTDDTFKNYFSDQELENVLLMMNKNNYSKNKENAYVINDNIINMYFELDEYYNFINRNKNQFKNTLSDPWQLGIDHNIGNDKNIFEKKKKFLINDFKIHKRFNKKIKKKKKRAE